MSFFSRVHAKLQSAMSVGRSVGRSVGQSVGQLVGDTLLFWRFQLLPKFLVNLFYHRPCPPARDFGSRVYSLVFLLNDWWKFSGKKTRGKKNLRSNKFSSCQTNSKWHFSLAQKINWTWNNEDYTRPPEGFLWRGHEEKRISSRIQKIYSQHLW